MIAWNVTNSIGIGLAFAAMPNLIFAAVPQSETGEATGFNTLVRSVGASLGLQVSGSILAGNDRSRLRTVALDCGSILTGQSFLPVPLVTRHRFLNPSRRRP